MIHLIRKFWITLLAGGMSLASFKVFPAPAANAEEEEASARLVAVGVKSFVESQVASRMTALQDLSGLASSRQSAETWKRQATLVMQGHPDIRILLWVDPARQALAALTQSGSWAALLESEQARETLFLARSLGLPRGVTFAGSSDLFLCVPIVSGGEFTGWVVAIVDSARFLDGTLRSAALTYSIALYSKDCALYRRDDSAPGVRRSWRHMAAVRLPGTLWLLDVWPRSTAAEEFTI